jgi:hypothetical protein
VMGNEAGVGEAASRLGDAVKGVTELGPGMNAWQKLCAAEAAITPGTLLRLPGAPAELTRTIASAPSGWHMAAHGADGLVRAWPAGGAERATMAKTTGDPATTRIADLIRKSFDPAGILPSGTDGSAGGRD